MKKKLFCIILAAAALLSACGKVAPPEENNAASPVETAEPDIPPEPVFTEIEIIAAGDNLLHNTVSKDSKTDDGYDYRHLYTHIKDKVKSADIAFINQEVMLTGEVNGYPNMSAPAEVADALIDTGFNVINLATNHSLDRGEEGLSKSVENTNARPFDAVLGAFATEEDSEKLIIVEKKGVKFGFLSYTYGLNGYSLKKGNEWKIALIDRQKITEDMKRLRPECDYLIVSMHWGNEYQHTPTSSEKEYAALLCDLGADLIIGTHPHVLQPLETLASSDGAHTTVCMYSLGNFISHQQKSATMLGGMLDVKLVFDEDKKVVSCDAGVIPTVTHYNSSSRGFAIYPLSEYTPELAEKHGIRKYDKPMTLDYLNGLADKVLGDAQIR
ncbi:MAG: CapA family protein [Clostridia bacterium]|nr:CapA family protein [Clostridia bacterium]